MMLTLQLFDERGDRGVTLLAAAAVWALVFAALYARRLPDLGLAVGVAALALAAVGTADLLSDAALTLAWAAQALVFLALTRRLGDARLHAFGLIYVGLAAVSVLVSAGNPAYLFDRAADQLAGVLPLAAVAVAAIGGALLPPEAYRSRTESGLLAFVAAVRTALDAHRRGVRETLAFVGAAFGTLSAAFLLVSFSFEAGHVAASFLAAAVGSILLAAAARIRSTALAVASYAWLGVVLVEAWVDGARFVDDLTSFSIGGWSVLAASAALLLGAYAHRVLEPGRRAQDWLFGSVAVVVSVSATSGIALLTPDGGRLAGLGLLLVAASYVALAAGVFSREGFRNAATILWSLGLIVLVGAEALLIDQDIALVVAVAGTALGCAALARPLREMRLWLAGGALALVTTTAALLAQVQPWLDEGEIARSVAISSGACAVALIGIAALVWGREERWRDLATVAWAAGVVSVLATERVLLDDWRATAVAFALTGAALGLVAQPLRESRLWSAGLRDRRCDDGHRHRAADSAVASPCRIRRSCRRALGALGVSRRTRGRRHHVSRPRPASRHRGHRRRDRALRPLTRDPRGRRARVERLRGDRFRARAHRCQRVVGPRRARAARCRVAARLGRRSATAVSRCSVSASRRSFSTTSRR